MSNLNVANTILEQLGGRRFASMTGAKTFVGSSDSLTFRLPSNFAKDRINMVRIKLNAMDLYDIEFMYTRGMNLKTVAEFKDVYAEDMDGIFVSTTGLNTRLF